MANSRVDFWSFITELVTRNPTMGIPALEDGLFANLLFFDYFWVFEFLKVGKVEKVRKVEKVYRPWEVSHLFYHKISCRMPSESCLGTPWGPRYEHIYKNIRFNWWCFVFGWFVVCEMVFHECSMIPYNTIVYDLNLVFMTFKSRSVDILYLWRCVSGSRFVSTMVHDWYWIAHIRLCVFVICTNFQRIFADFRRSPMMFPQCFQRFSIRWQC